MIIVVYTSDDPAIAPARRCLAQFEVLPKARPAAERGPDEPAEADDDLLGDLL